MTAYISDEAPVLYKLNKTCKLQLHFLNEPIETPEASGIAEKLLSDHIIHRKGISSSSNHCEIVRFQLQLIRIPRSFRVVDLKDNGTVTR